MKSLKVVIFILSLTNYLVSGNPLPALNDDIAKDLISAIKEKMQVDDVIQDMVILKTKNSSVVKLLFKFGS